jgi:two-component system, NarL family, response regulator YdfI
MIRVLIIATAAVARAGLSSALSIDPQIEIVGTAKDLETLAAQIDRSPPDAILLDLGDLPQTSIWEQLTLLQAGRAAIIPIALYDWDGDFQMAFQAGVRGILPDTSTERELSAAIIAIACGWLVLPPNAIALFNAREQVSIPSVHILTPREIEVLVQIGAGLANKAIAQTLHISDHTVKFHISSIFQKLHVSTRTEAVTAGIRLGLILL